MCHNVFNLWPKTTLLPAWPRDGKRLDTPGLGTPARATWPCLSMNNSRPNHRATGKKARSVVASSPSLTDCTWTRAALVQPNPDSLHAFDRCLSFHSCKTGIVIYLIKAICIIKIRKYELCAVLAQDTVISHINTKVICKHVYVNIKLVVHGWGYTQSLKKRPAWGIILKIMPCSGWCGSIGWSITL